MDKFEIRIEKVKWFLSISDMEKTRLTGRSQGAWSLWLNGKRDMGIKTIKAEAAKLDMTPLELFAALTVEDD